MDQLISNSDLRAGFGAAGHRRLQEVFTFETFAARMARLMDDSLART
jgi:hypothetical protein